MDDLLTSNENSLLKHLNKDAMTINKKPVVGMVRGLHMYMQDTSFAFDEYQNHLTMRLSTDQVKRVEEFASKLYGSPLTTADIRMSAVGVHTIGQFCREYLPNELIVPVEETQNSIIQFGWKLLEHYNLIYPTRYFTLVFPELKIHEYNSRTLSKRTNEYTLNPDILGDMLGILYTFTSQVVGNQKVVAQSLRSVLQQHHLTAKELVGANKEVVMLHNPHSWS